MLSILPKCSKSKSVGEENDDNVFLNEAALFSGCLAREEASQEKARKNRRPLFVCVLDLFFHVILFGSQIFGLKNLTKSSKVVLDPDLSSEDGLDPIWS